MRIIVSKDNLADVSLELAQKPELVFDTETTGLYPYHSSTMFSVAISSDSHSYYFNFIPYEGLEEKFVLEYLDLKPIMDQKKTWIAHNAKFDLAFMTKAGITPQGRIIDTEVLSRIYQNYHYSHSLDNCGDRYLGEKKDDRVMKWMNANNAYIMALGPDKKWSKNYQFNTVPFGLISEYAMRDCELTYRLYTFLKASIPADSKPVVEMESKLTPVIFEMEKAGIKVDLDFCSEALEFEEQRLKEIETEWKIEFGTSFVDSSKSLAPFFSKRLGTDLPISDKGNPVIADWVLTGLKDPWADKILEYRNAKKRASTYFSSFIHLATSDGTIHTNVRQGGTVTGRMSSTTPNLQNLSADDDSNFPVRRAFIPRDTHLFVSIDFSGMEFRLALEYANEKTLIEKIKLGHDPHDATSELTGLTRKAAKTLNFGLLYGMGIKKLAEALKVTDTEAREFKYQYFRALPNVKRLIYEAKTAMENRGFIRNWLGRYSYMDDPRYSYKAANTLIQGGCADIAKTAMVECSEFLKNHKSQMLLQVHDEILFEIPFEEVGIIRKLKSIMEKAYPARNMPMATSVAYSFQSFGDMLEVKDESEITDAVRKRLSKKGPQGFEDIEKDLVLQGIGEGA